MRKIKYRPRTDAVKVIALWAGKRRDHSETTGNLWARRMLKKIVNQELALDYGVKMDLILVNSVSKDGTPKGYAELLERYDGLKTKNGKIIVEHKKNLGISYGAFDYVFQKYMNHYNYWFFTEDDWVTVHDGAMKEGIGILKNDKKIKFVSSAGLCHKGIMAWPGRKFGGGRNRINWTYAVGGCGITSTAILKKFLASDELIEINVTLGNRNRHLPYAEIEGHANWGRESMLHCLAERQFTSMPGKISILSKLSCQYDHEEGGITFV